jgi:CheY-like chemotaxis protein
LVIDDEASIRQVFDKLSKLSVYLVVTAESGAEALSIYAQRKTEIAAVITRYDDAYDERRGHDRGTPAPQSGGKDNYCHRRAEKISDDGGAREFLAKPFTIEKFLAILARVLPSPAVGASAR